MMGINGAEAAIIAVIILLIVGPERLPDVAKQGATWLRTAVRYVRDAGASLTEEFGDEIADLREFDPRQYDPRTIVRQAMAEPRTKPRSPVHDPTKPAPFDSEAT